MLRDLNDIIADCLRAIRETIGVQETDSNRVARLRMIYLLPYIVVGLSIVWAVKVPVVLVWNLVVGVINFLVEQVACACGLFASIFETVGDRVAETRLMWRWNQPK